MQRPDLYWSSNLGGTLALLEAMRVAGVSRIVFSSTAAVYGEPEAVPITETAPARPTSPCAQPDPAGGWLGERHTTETHLIPNILAVALRWRPQRGLREMASEAWAFTCARAGA